MFIDDHEYVRLSLGDEELLTQLAEECAELCKAALKLRRSLSGKNPTPVQREDAFHDVIEEVADVFLCVAVLNYDTDAILAEVSEISDKKLTRWVERLKALSESEAKGAEG